MNHDDDAFDARQRDAWRTAIDAVPPTVARRLRPAARESRAPSRWPLGAALGAAVVVALAIGLRTHPIAFPRAASNPAIATIDAADTSVMLDRNPDFYAWLASPDAEQLAME